MSLRGEAMTACTQWIRFNLDLVRFNSLRPLAFPRTPSPKGAIFSPTSLAEAGGTQAAIATASTTEA